MELVKSKGMVIFIILLFSFTIVHAINTKKYDERNKELQDSYISMNIK